ncbi:MAG: hypothetical protein JSW06_04670 [Thermoplasmatales archaeon]|nr:MAG: hypothetical protein JSW06_04670 [Thermoplasmatales archaeon]
MKKIIPILIVGVLIISGFGAVAVTEDKKEDVIFETFPFSRPTFHEKEDYISIRLTESNSDSWETGKPILPVVTKVYTFPFGTRVDSVEVTFSDTLEEEISKPIEPAPEPIMKNTKVTSVTYEKSKMVSYSDIDIYPESRYSYRTGAGLNGEERVIYLIISLYPVQYNPNQNTVYYSKSATVDVRYTTPENPVNFLDVYDLLIIAPEEFSSALQPLVEHKNGIGIDTKLTTLDEIPSVGVDEQESIKYYVKDAIENWDITYLLLVGAGVKDAEIFPVRYAWIPSDQYEENFPSDLYYADIYDGAGGFSSWDYDGDGKYAEYPIDMPAVDVIPDVYLGKLPANSASEVSVVVNKIINYKEHNKMTNKILQIGGDTFPGDDEGIYEGEFANEDVLSRLPGYSTRRLWGSNGQMTKSNIAKGFRSCVDFVDFSGHGSRLSWSTHPPDDEHTWIPPAELLSSFTGWLYVDFDLFFVLNSKKLPVVFYNACSNNKYTGTETCLAWKTLMKPDGGGIAAFGASGIGYGSHGSHETERLMGWMEVHTHEEIFNNKILGLAWSNCITNYYSTFQSDLDKIDYKTMLEYSMFADPTLAIEDGDDPESIPVNIPSFLLRFIERVIERFPRLEQLFSLLLKHS